MNLNEKEMKIKLKVKQEFEVSILHAKCGVRYWEDSVVNGIEDVEGDLIPCREGDYWCPIIDIDLGIITNWKQGTKADIHYKVCDDGYYSLLDKNNNVVKKIEGYVPNIICPEGDGYGDYVIMNVDENGKIANWNPSLKEFK